MLTLSLLAILLYYSNAEKEEVFTVPPHSTWNPYGIHVIPVGFHPFHMEYVLAGIPAILVISIHLKFI
jgi:hypothetical protein